jgi:outer membrane biosynthesis protein TonB
VTSAAQIARTLFLCTCAFLAASCATTSSAPLTGMDSACASVESCTGLPPQCTADFFPREAYGPGTKEERKERAQQITKRILSNSDSSWALSQPKPQYPRAFLRQNNLQPASFYLRALVDEKGAVSRVCYTKLEGNPAFVRNAVHAFQYWVVAPKVLNESSHYPFIAEVQFIFRISKGS